MIQVSCVLVVQRGKCKMINPQDPKFQAIILKAHLKLLASGMTNSRHSGKQILEAASRLTKNKYKRGQYKQALADLATI